MTNSEIEDLMTPYLGNEEKILWTGIPNKGIVFQASDILLIPFSLVWGGFALFWEISVLAAGAPILFKLWGIPFVLMGIYITVGRFFYDSWKRSKIAYAITNKRALILKREFSQKIVSIPLSRDLNIEYNSNSKGRAAIKFGESGASIFSSSSWPGMNSKQNEFFQIEEGRKVYSQLLDLQK